MAASAAALKSLILRLSGAPPSGAGDAAAVFRGFAEAIEQRLGGGDGGGPKVRLPLPAEPFARAGR